MVFSRLHIGSTGSYENSRRVCAFPLPLNLPSICLFFLVSIACIPAYADQTQTIEEASNDKKVNTSVGNFFRKLGDGIDSLLSGKKEEGDNVDPDSQSASTNNSANTADGAYGLSVGQNREIQLLLTKLGYTPGPIDGLPGQKTFTAIRTYQRDNGERETGTPSLKLLNSLRSDFVDSSAKLANVSLSGDQEYLGSDTERRVELTASRLCNGYSISCKDMMIKVTNAWLSEILELTRDNQLARRSFELLFSNPGAIADDTERLRVFEQALSDDFFSSSLKKKIDNEFASAEHFAPAGLDPESLSNMATSIATSIIADLALDHLIAVVRDRSGDRLADQLDTWVEPSIEIGALAKGLLVGSATATGSAVAASSIWAKNVYSFVLLGKNLNKDEAIRSDFDSQLAQLANQNASIFESLATGERRGILYAGHEPNKLTPKEQELLQSMLKENNARQSELLQKQAVLEEFSWVTEGAKSVASLVSTLDRSVARVGGVANMTLAGLLLEAEKSETPDIEEVRPEVAGESKYSVAHSGDAEVGAEENPQNSVAVEQKTLREKTSETLEVKEPKNEQDQTDSNLEDADSNPVSKSDDVVEDAAAIAVIQKKLREFGYDAGPADGNPGQKTREAIILFQAANGQAITGDPTLELLARLAANDDIVRGSYKAPKATPRNQPNQSQQAKSTSTSQDRPSDELVKRMVMNELSKRVHCAWVNATIPGRNARIRRLEILQWGQTHELTREIPARIRVAGTAKVVPPFGKSWKAKFDDVGEFRFSKNDFGEWRYRFVSPKGVLCTY